LRNVVLGTPREVGVPARVMYWAADSLTVAA